MTMGITPLNNPPFSLMLNLPDNIPHDGKKHHCPNCSKAFFSILNHLTMYTFSKTPQAEQGDYMRKLIGLLHISLDASVGEPGEMGWIKISKELFSLGASEIEKADTGLYGPSTFHKPPLC